MVLSTGGPSGRAAAGDRASALCCVDAGCAVVLSAATLCVGTEKMSARGPACTLYALRAARAPPLLSKGVDDASGGVSWWTVVRRASWTIRAYVRARHARLLLLGEGGPDGAGGASAAWSEVAFVARRRWRRRDVNRLPGAAAGRGWSRVGSTVLDVQTSGPRANVPRVNSREMKV